MNIAAYCRVSTDKEDQLNSLEIPKAFFSEYTKRTGDTLIRLYADEGIPQTKIKNCKEILVQLTRMNLPRYFLPHLHPMKHQKSVVMSENQ
jgi:DNA invertase Pin-like site-specific DNA recombinase